jgi:hypothetical protein
MVGESFPGGIHNEGYRTSSITSIVFIEILRGAERASLFGWLVGPVEFTFHPHQHLEG